MEYVIGIGSNQNRTKNMQLARRSLSSLFPDIRFSQEEETAPLFFTRIAPFSNQLACFISARPLDEIVSLLKEIEKAAGRLPEDKQKEIVKLDIDVLMCDGHVCRREDWERAYVQRGLQELDIVHGAFDNVE